MRNYIITMATVEAHSQRAGWVTRRERVEEKGWRKEKRKQEVCKEICMNEKREGGGVNSSPVMRV